MDLPAGFMAQFATLGVAALDALPQSLAAEPSVSVRYNSRKGASVPEGCDPVAWCPTGCYLAERPAFTLDPAMHQGLYYVQDASSMFIHHVIDHLTASGEPVRYLDACAAPGGKTTAALDVLPAGSLAVANEYVAARASMLRENLAKWGVPCVVRQGDTSRFAADGAVFDIIAADVPCSGEGMMRKDAKAVEQWTPALVAECAARQRQIVDNLWLALAPGGYMIYSTCTFNRTENEEMVQYMIDRYGAEPVEIPVDPSWSIIPAIGNDFPAYRFIPGAIRGEGLFMAVVRKPLSAEAVTGSGRQKKQKQQKQRDNRSRKETIRIPAEVREWLLPESGVDLSVSAEGNVVAMLRSQWADFPYMPEIEMATLKGRDLIPTQMLAMSCFLNPEAFPCHEVDKNMALEYLRNQAVTLPVGTPRGMVLLTYGGDPLGFVKNIGSRANNLYPRSWRILK